MNLRKYKNRVIDSKLRKTKDELEGDNFKFKSYSDVFVYVAQSWEDVTARGLEIDKVFVTALIAIINDQGVPYKYLVSPFDMWREVSEQRISNDGKSSNYLLGMPSYGFDDSVVNTQKEKEARESGRWAEFFNDLVSKQDVVYSSFKDELIIYEWGLFSKNNIKGS